MARIRNAGLLLLLPLLLFGCVLAPGKFVSTLAINADRSFTFTYKGEVIMIDIAQDMGRSLGTGGSPDQPPATPDDSSGSAGAATLRPIAGEGEEASEEDSKAEAERKNRAVAEALAKEPGYRSVEYKGDGKFLIDYAITSRLSHGFVYPYNLDAQAIFPFLLIELRPNGAVRVRAPAFGNENSGNMPGGSQAASRLDGRFTLDTDAEVISQNSEDGVTTTGRRRSISWRATPTLRAAPMAVLKLAPLP